MPIVVLPSQPSTLVLSGTADSTSSNTGALQVAGGVGIAKNLVIGKNVTISYGQTTGYYGLMNANVSAIFNVGSYSFVNGTQIGFLNQAFNSDGSKYVTAGSIDISAQTLYWNTPATVYGARLFLEGGKSGPGATQIAGNAVFYTANTERMRINETGDVVIAGNLSTNNMNAFRNKINNGSMRIAQRGTSATGINGGGYYTVDRWYVYVGDGTYTSAQIALSTTDLPYQNGLIYSNRLTTTTASTNLGMFIDTGIEGLYCQDTCWGTSNGSYMTLSFWFRSNLATNSVFCNTIKVLSGGSSGTINYTYNIQFTYTVASTNWQKVVQVIPPPPSGFTMNLDTNVGIAIEFFVYWDRTGTNGSWTSGNSNGVAGTTNWSGTANTYVEFTGVQFEKGTLATPFELLPYNQELLWCQRYYEKRIVNGAMQYVSPNNTSYGSYITFLAPKRVTPTTSTITNAGAWSSTGLNVTGLTGGIDSLTIYGGAPYINSANYIYMYTGTMIISSDI
jgi:hypothetical protein